MPLPRDEPTSPEAVARWIREQTAAVDRFTHIYKASEAHRERHGPRCSVYPTSSGPALGVLAAATGAKRILELGCGLGYSALWLAFGSSPDGFVETIERDPNHAALARRNVLEEGYERRITVHDGPGVDVLARVTGPYDLIFNDGDLEEYQVDLDHFFRLLRPGGLLASSNLFLGQYRADLPGLDMGAAYRLLILEDPRLLTAFLPGGLALSVLRT